MEALGRSGLASPAPGPPDFVLALGPRPGGRAPEAESARVWRFEVEGAPATHLRRVCREAVSAAAGSVTARLLESRGGRADRLLRAGRLPVVRHSVRRTVASVTDELVEWPAEACRIWAETGEPYGPRGEVPATQTEGSEAVSRAARSEGHLRVVPLALRCLLRGVSGAARILVRPDAWNIGLVHVPPERFLEGWPEAPVSWSRPADPPGFKADPFGLVVDGRLYVLYEEADPGTGRGRIVAEEWDESARVLDRRPVLEKDVHLSYPYLLAHRGQVFCLPEMADAERVVLFRAVDFPWTWEEEAVLLADVPLLDATLFRHDGRWWMLGTDRRRGPRHVLLAWHADDLTGPWRPHAANPVKIDIHAARPAGPPFRAGGELYRPAQDGAGRYGAAVALNRILELTPRVFREETVRRLAPGDAAYPSGFHTLAGAGSHLTLVDGNRTPLALSALWRRLRRALRVWRRT